MTEKIKVHIDPRGYNEKPASKEIGGIKARLQKSTSPSLVTLEELVQKIETGHSISPGIMDGMSAKNWKEQQLFLVDIDNEEVGPMLHIKDAKAICRDNGLSLALYYQTFSYTKEHPKFRLGFVMDKPITDEGMRKRIMETLVNLFPQSDKSCINADRIFHGTVTAISEATGSKYSLVPTDNSAGNFVKIQQRIPVRIDLIDVSPEDMNLLRAGMMVETEALKRH